MHWRDCKYGGKMRQNVKSAVKQRTIVPVIEYINCKPKIWMIKQKKSA
jgi:hypothetical protein